MSTSTAPTEAHTSVSTSVLERLRTAEGGFYLGTPNIANHAEFHIGGREGDVLVIKNMDEVPTEFILRGIFRIDQNNFFLTPDANFDPSNTLGIKLASVKASCRLGPVKRDSIYVIPPSEILTVIANIRAIEALAPKQKDAEISSILTTTGQGPSATYSIKLSHGLFKKKKSGGNTVGESGDGPSVDENSSDDGEDTTSVNDWPVQNRCREDLANISETHVVVPIPAFGQDGKRIGPESYERRLCGAVVEAHFAIIHHHIKKSKRSTFSAAIRRIIILRAPVHKIASPMKKLGSKRSHDSNVNDEGSSRKKRRT